MRALKHFLFSITLLSTMPSFADDNRQGFFLGFGAGFHNINIDLLYDGSNIGSRSESGFATSFKIGGGITNQFALYYVRNSSWYSAPYFDGFTTKDITYAVGLTGIGASYFLSPSAPSAYFLVALGAGDFSAPFESDIASDTGGAFMLGGGYEFGKHVMVEATLLSTSIDSSGDSLLTVETSSFQLAINYVFY